MKLMYLGKQFVTDRRGSTAVIFSLSAIVLCAALGLSIDYARYLHATQALQAAVDTAALNLASRRQGGIDVADGDLAALLKTNWAQPHGTTPAIGSIDESQANIIRVNAKSVMQTTFAAVTGLAKVNIVADATSRFGISKSEVALALDVTGSMAGAKLETLKSTAKELVETLYKTPGADQKIRVAVVPFGNYVNVGLSYRAASWMSVPSDSTTPYCYKYRPVISKSGCTITKVPQFIEGTGVVYYDQETCSSYEYGPEQEVCGNSESKWYGCVGSRQSPFNRQALVTASNPVPGLMNLQCSSPLLRLTNQKSDQINAIESLVATGETYLPAGLIWGWRVLSTDTPFADSEQSATAKPRRSLVFMTDGQNTKSQDGEWHWGIDLNSANSLTATLCSEIKANNIELYAVAFEVTDANTLSLMKSCASSASHFFDAGNAEALSNSFKAIANALSTVRLSK